MTEKQADYVIWSCLVLVNAFCLPMFFIANSNGFEDKNSIWFLLNMLVYQKFYWGMRSYEIAKEKGKYQCSGKKLLEYAFLRFF